MSRNARKIVKSLAEKGYAPREMAAQTGEGVTE